MSKQDSEPTKEELEQRVNQLEQTVQKMMPNRRQAIKGLGLLGGGALLGGVGSQEAEAATGSAGSVGTSSDRPDVFADTVDSNSLSTENVNTDPNAAGYSWTEVSRSFDNWYTTPDRDIVFALSVDVNSSSTTVDIRPDVNRSQSNNAVIRLRDTYDAGIVTVGPIRAPANQHYRVRAGADTADFSLNKWMELR